MTFSLLGTDTQTGKRIEIPQSSRRQGLYIIGANGTGKTGLIENLIMQDIAQGLGVCLLDPHGDLTNSVLVRLPEKRLPDTIVLDLANEESPFGLNLFACDNPKSAKAVQYVVDQVMHVFEKIFDVSRSGTPLLLHYLRNCTHTLVANPGYTMADIPLLLTERECRQKLVANVTDPQVRRFWQEYESMKPNEQREERSSIQRRLGEFLQPLTCNIVGQHTTSINFRQLMDERKIVLVTLDPRLESVTSLIGSVLIAMLLNAAYSRSDLDLQKRKQFNLYADEFQRFATEDFATLLTEARKFGIATTIGHQTLSQISEKNQAAALQAANLVVFRVTGPDSQELASNFDCTPPSPTETIGQRPILAPVTNVIGHLVKKGHTNKIVSQFATNYLMTSEAAFKGTFATHPVTLDFWHFTHADAEAGTRELNKLLYECMSEGRSDKVIPAHGLIMLAAAQENGSAIALKQHIRRNSGWNYTGWKDSISEVTHPLFLADQQRVQAFINRHASYTYWDTLTQNRHLTPGYSFVLLLLALRQTMDCLAHEPILIDTGQHEPLYDKPRTYADMQNEIASRLANLPKFTARVKIATDNGTVEQTIKTLTPERGVGRGTLQQRKAMLLQQNLAAGYIRKREAVEEELQLRQESCCGSSLPPERFRPIRDV